MERKLILKTNSKPLEGLVLINILCYFLGPSTHQFLLQRIRKTFSHLPERYQFADTSEKQKERNENISPEKNVLESQTDDFRSHIQRKYSTIGLISV